MEWPRGAAVEEIVAAAERRLAAGDRFVQCDLGQAASDGLGTVDQLARLRLLARRRHCRLAITTGDPELRRLITLAGLDDVLWTDP